MDVVLVYVFYFCLTFTPGWERTCSLWENCHLIFAFNVSKQNHNNLFDVWMLRSSYYNFDKKGYWYALRVIEVEQVKNLRVIEVEQVKNLRVISDPANVLNWKVNKWDF